LKRALSYKININRSNFFEIGNHNILHLIDEFSKNISIKARDDYANNNIIDGLNTLKMVHYDKNHINILDIHSFSCLYNPNDKTVNTSLFKQENRVQRIPHPIGKFNFYNFK